jgi:hypothetical protein
MHVVACFPGVFTTVQRPVPLFQQQTIILFLFHPFQGLCDDSVPFLVVVLEPLDALLRHHDTGSLEKFRAQAWKALAIF